MKMFKMISVFLVSILILIGCSDASDSAATEENSEPTVYTTIYSIEYAAKRIAGDSIAIETVYPPGVDELTYELTMQDMKKLADSDSCASI